MEILKQDTKPLIFQNNAFFQVVKRFVIEAQMNELSRVFLEKSEFQHRRISLLFTLLGIPSIWGSQNDVFQLKYLRSKIEFFDCGKTRVMKKFVPKY